MKQHQKLYVDEHCPKCGKRWDEAGWMHTPDGCLAVSQVKALQAQSVLETFEAHAEYIRIGRLAGGRWRVVFLSNADWKTSGQCDGADLLDALAQVAQVLSQNGPNERNG